jgi:hypothetical protein
VPREASKLSRWDDTLSGQQRKSKIRTRSQWRIDPLRDHVASRQPVAKVGVSNVRSRAKLLRDEGLESRRRDELANPCNSLGEDVLVGRVGEVWAKKDVKDGAGRRGTREERRGGHLGSMMGETRTLDEVMCYGKVVNEGQRGGQRKSSQRCRGTSSAGRRRRVSCTMCWARQFQRRLSDEIKVSFYI